MLLLPVSIMLHGPKSNACLEHIAQHPVDRLEVEPQAGRGWACTAIEPWPGRRKPDDCVL